MVLIPFPLIHFKIATRLDLNFPKSFQRLSHTGLVGVSFPGFMSNLDLDSYMPRLQKVNILNFYLLFQYV